MSSITSYAVSLSRGPKVTLPAVEMIEKTRSVPGTETGNSAHSINAIRPENEAKPSLYRVGDLRQLSTG